MLIKKPIDLFSADFTYGQRLFLSKAFEKTELFDICYEVIKTLHNVKIKQRHMKKVLPYIHQIAGQLKQWCEKEKLLRYEPTPEEKQAGIYKLGEIIKEFGQVDSIAQRQHISHDEVLKLPYNTVFMIFLTDLEKSKFERRMQKNNERKWKK